MKCKVCGKEIPKDKCIRCGCKLKKGEYLKCKRARYVDEQNIEYDKELRSKGQVPPKWDQIMAETLQNLDARCDECREKDKRESDRKFLYEWARAKSTRPRF